jgi:hypothetical protein
MTTTEASMASQEVHLLEHTMMTRKANMLLNHSGLQTPPDITDNFQFIL